MFFTDTGQFVASVTTAQMREVDRIAVEEFGLGLLLMMENAGRNLAISVMGLLSYETDSVITILAGSGGNGCGGLCCARHLLNHGFRVQVILDRASTDLQGAASIQWTILRHAGVTITPYEDASAALGNSDIIVDALIGYSLRGIPWGRAADLIMLCNRASGTVVSLDIPSGVDATTGQHSDIAVVASRTLTLAAPKAGLRGISGEIYLADIGIPPGVYEKLGIAFQWPWVDRYSGRLTVKDNSTRN